MAGLPESILFRLLGVFRHLLRRCALYRPTAQFLYHRFRGSAACMGEALRFIVDHRARLAPSFPLALLGRRPPVGHAYPHLLAVRLCLQVARPVRIPEIHPGIRFYLCGRLPRFRHLLSGGNGQTARHSLLHPPHSAKPSSFVLSAGKNSRGCSPRRLTTVRSTNGKPWDSSSFWEPEPWA